MIEPASTAKFSKARRNRIFVLGVVAGATLMLLLNLAINASTDRAASAPATTVTVTANPTNPTEPTAPNTTAGLGIDMARRIADDPTAIGATDAPVVIVEYADYRCPFCSLFEQKTLPLIISEYVDKGHVRFEFRDTPIFGEQSVDAAVAGRAAGKQGKFWQYMSAVAANGVVEGGHPNLTRERLTGFAEAAGVGDIAQFTADLDDPALLDAVRADLAEARQLGFSGVPAFLVGDVPVVGAQPIETFRKVIDQKLDEAGIVR